MAESPRLREVLDFLNARGFSLAAAALKDDVIALGTDLDVSRPPPVRITPENRAASSTSSSGDAFVSMGSSPSEFLNPCALWSPVRAGSEDSSGRYSEFQTARDYHSVNPFSDTHWYDDPFEYHLIDSQFLTTNSAGWHGEDKFVMSIEAEEKFRKENDVSVHDKNGHDKDVKCEGCTEVYSYSFPICDCCSGLKKAHDFERTGNPDSTVYERYLIMDDETERLEECGVTEYQLKRVDGPPETVHLVENSVHDPKLEGEKKSLEPGNDPTSYRKDIISSKYVVEGCFTSTHHEVLQSKGVDIQNVKGKPRQPVRNDAFDIIDYGTMNGEMKDSESVEVGDKDHGVIDELPAYNSLEEEYEIFDLRIVHRKNRTGFEENKDLPIVLNSVIGGRYYVTEYLGSAAFSKVVQAHDLQMGVDVCLKIIKNDKDFFDQSLDEIKLLKYVNKNDPADERHLLRLYDYFYHQEHLFIVCELLRANLYEFQKYNQDSGEDVYFTLPRIQAIARQCLEALEYLHQLGIIHCDLKPENILIKSYSRCEIKVIDLGSSCFLTDNLCLYVQSRSYRAPEVILGLSYDQRIDLWSLGCILAELYSGDVLFPNDSVVMMLARMIGIVGPIDMEMLKMGLETHKYFTDDYDLYYTNEETDQIEYLIPEKSTLARELQVSDKMFLDFLEHLLQINPQRRPTAKQALQHPWLSFSYH
ncbi:homeodomain-interacting protein kinase 2-like [Dioscorea cayenensis subsp. rotundata]|uniref:Homeodomain-interacting protein kinase 2-like n=1 Tax=Dioscorea cayennensis subsp. rotundata TaxID=55577 RepID=A0AB40BXC3_DIOCR|nr:homeodomain-interacting protein kinase 2-like [Dioscorea cayenensis subsp. rotundata]